MIGIFDSGSGGFTVLKAIREQMPSADILYFGDIKNAPYGEKSREELSRLTINSIRVLQARGATSIVSACNSVSASLAVSLFDTLGLAQQNLIEMVGPTVSCFKDFKKPILLAATPATILSELYQNAFRMLGTTIDTVAIPKLAGAIEFGISAKDQELLVAAAFAPYDLKKYGAVILACTHYPLALASFRKVLGDLPFFDPAEAVADRVRQQLWPLEVGNGTLRLLVSRDTPQFRAHVTKLLPDASYVIEVLD
ncbi:aspartate/glutamate racemase family protein [Candidatus Kaiserbacteria bacterium]|nr:aspartate/glutamate racemase family protein [Candidatus Kaiserbacteria bacterium]